MKGRIFFTSGLLTVLFILGCTQFESWVKPLARQKEPVVSCAVRVVDQAYDLYEEAKSELARYFDTRDTNHLFTAYYASTDSTLLSRSLSKCSDRQQSDVFTMRNLIRLNRSLRGVVRLNMRDEDASELIAIYRDQYNQVIINDIE